MIVKQIVEGFVKSDKKTWIDACSSVTLIMDGKKVILVDTGGRGFFKIIKESLKKEGLSPQEVTDVINTHSHPDHIWNNAFFENATFVNSAGILKDKFYWKNLPLKIGKNIEVISTPGHSDDGCSVIVKTPEGVYCIAGDLFYLDQDKIPSFEKNASIIQNNRNKLLKIVNWVIPGHGKKFEVTR
jgi:glyoxylase-like metal-dependent hydrolase (beta-lactamase superfamily II)